MDFSIFDTRQYETLSVREGYRQWVKTYEQTVLDLMDLRLLARLQTVIWGEPQRALDLACGTGRTGVWLKQHGVKQLDGLDLTVEMLAVARAKRVYENLLLGDVLSIPIAAHSYELTTMVLADEHLADLTQLYREVARITKPSGHFVLVGYHPYFLLAGIPTHFDREGGEPVAIESYVHLFSDHFQAAKFASWSLLEVQEGLIDEQWLSKKPKWKHYLYRPVSFALVWQKTA